MSRTIAWILAPWLGACATQQLPPPTVASTETVQEGAATLSIELSYQTVEPRQVTLNLNMHVGQFEQTERLESTILITGFNVHEGSLRWSGFVMPREPQRQTVTLEIPPDFDEATATLTLQRSSSSTTLFREELTFVVADDGSVSLRGGE